MVIFTHESSFFVARGSARTLSHSESQNFLRAPSSLSSSNSKDGLILLNLLIVKFSTGELVMLELGIVTMVSLPVLIMVVLRPMLITSPSTSSTMIQSPTLKGWSMIIEIAPNMLATESFAAKASARPVIPRPAIIPFRFSPTSPARTKAPTITTASRPIASATLARDLLAAMLSPSTTMNASR